MRADRISKPVLRKYLSLPAIFSKPIRYQKFTFAMTLKEFELTEDNHFVAMEYYYLILNRTYLILLTKDYLIGLQGNGIVGVEGSEDLFTKQAIKFLAIRGDLSNPYSYLKEKYIREIENEDLFDKSIIFKNETNFIIDRANIKNVYYDSKKKWGMGYYPHDGKVYIETSNNKKREFIILGSQSGQKIANLIITK